MVRSLIILLLMSSCFSVTHQKDKLYQPKSMLNMSIPIRLDGFYYCELTTATDKDMKGIMALLLYKDGYLINDGVYYANGNNYCVQYGNNENTISNSLNKYKSRLQLLKSEKVINSCKINNNDIDGKGLFIIKGDSIKIQVYKAEMKNEKKDSFNDYFLYEFEGIILNNEAFQITKKINYRINITEKVNLFYRFEKDENKPIMANTFTGY